MDEDTPIPDAPLPPPSEPIPDLAPPPESTPELLVPESPAPPAETPAPELVEPEESATNPPSSPRPEPEVPVTVPPSLNLPAPTALATAPVFESGAETPGNQAPAAEPASPSVRPLNVRDALSYLEMVKVKFNDKPDVYNHFLDIMKDFKSQTIDTPGVIERVSTLFTGHPSLIQGFNTFLPAGYRIECSQDGQDTNVITVTTPTGTTTTTAGAMNSLSRIASGSANMPVPNAGPVSSAWQAAPGGSLPSNTVAGSSEGGPGSLGPLPTVFTHPLDGPNTPSMGAATTILGNMKPAVYYHPTIPAPEFNHAIQYVNKIKMRFTNDPDTYKQFLEILQTYQKEQRSIQDVYAQVTSLFKNAPDLLDEFKQFLPDSNNPGSGGLFGMIGHMTASAGSDKGEKDKTVDKKKGAPNSSVGTADKAGAAAAPAKRKKRVLDKETAAAPKAGQSKPKRSKHHHKPEPQSPTYVPAASPGPSQPVANGHNGTQGNGHTTNWASSNAATIPDEAAFFDRVKKYIDDKPTFQEFLKLLNLFTQEIIDVRTLVDKSSTFLGENSELFAQFKDVLGFDDRNVVEVESGLKGVAGVVSALDRPKVDLNACKKYGPSYRKLPNNEIALACSGRDAMCWEVLNDEWVSHPTWASEDAGFSTHKKNAYEDALHKSEEERHEYDFHIEAIIRTIQVLEPIQARINLMDADERTHFKLKPGLGGQGKSIYQRIIKKVYGKDHGLEVIQSLHDSPSIAVPVVLARLKQKDEEWKRAQREWNKVWREVDARNYYKSLDHQGVNFKVNDKKALSAKQLVQDIEAKRREREKERKKLIDPLFVRTLPQDHYAFKLEGEDGPGAVLLDCIKLIISFLDRTSTIQLTRGDKQNVEEFLRTFFPMFFMLDSAEFDASFGGAGLAAPPTDAGGVDDMETDDAASDGAVDDTASASSSKRHGNGRDGFAGDLRKRLLKSTQNKGGRKAKGSSSQTPSRASPAPPSDHMHVDADAAHATNGDNGSHPTSNPDFTGESGIWVEYDANDPVASAASAFKALPKDKTGRKGNFFANNTFYVLLRQMQILYHRLSTCKALGQELAAGPAHSYLANPVAVELGLSDSTGPSHSRLVTSGPNPAKHFYRHLLVCCEQLFDNEMEQTAFEENLRFMFGIKAYLMFTVDKLIGVIIKQIQIILADSKCQDLMTLLQKEREVESPTTQQLISYRRQAENIVGPEDNLYRISWLNSASTMYIQLLAKDDISTDDATTMTERWKQYIESYTLPHQTEGLPVEVKPPLLRRSIDPETEGFLAPSAYISSTRLHIKVCIRTYRLFFVPGTEDFYWRKRGTEEATAIRSKSLEVKKEKSDKLAAWLASKFPSDERVKSPSPGETSLPNVGSSDTAAP